MATTLVGPSELLRRAWTRFKAHWLVAVIIALLMSYLSLAVTAISGRGLLAAGANLSLSAVLTGSFFLAVLMVIITVFFTAMLYILMNEDDNRAGFGSLFKKAGRVFWPLVITGIVSLLVTGGGFILFVIPAIILSIYFSQSTMVTISEGVSGMTALRRSRAMIQGKWGQILWRYIVITFVLVLANVVLLGLLKLIGVGAEAADDTATTIVGTIFGPLIVAYNVELYQELKGTKGEMGSKGFYTFLAILGILFGALFVNMMVNLRRDMSGTFQSAWQKALEETGQTTSSGSSSYNFQWNVGDTDSANVN